MRGGRGVVAGHGRCGHAVARDRPSVCAGDDAGPRRLRGRRRAAPARAVAERRRRPSRSPLTLGVNGAPDELAAYTAVAESFDSLYDPAEVEVRELGLQRRHDVGDRGRRGAPRRLPGEPRRPGHPAGRAADPARRRAARRAWGRLRRRLLPRRAAGVQRRRPAPVHAVRHLADGDLLQHPAGRLRPDGGPRPAVPRGAGGLDARDVHRGRPVRQPAGPAGPTASTSSRACAPSRRSSTPAAARSSTTRTRRRRWPSPTATASRRWNGPSRCSAAPS